ncbi:MAG: hypothetical protein Ct9H300mP1_10750 [Planctomycetaceae bacterium]|nr:MAG: hypothetical protein Ct9H300mP1_10750 [Planctomycetaceae bacterium]
MTRCLAAELGKRGITVNAVAPGFIETDMTEDIRNMAEGEIVKKISCRRLGNAEDFAMQRPTWPATRRPTSPATCWSSRGPHARRTLRLPAVSGMKNHRNDNSTTTWLGEVGMATNEEILGKIQEILANALGSTTKRSLRQRLLSGPGAESIDFLDIVFNLKKEFDIKIKRGELFPENLAAEGDGLAVDGVVTKEGGRSCGTAAPADVDRFPKTPKGREHPGSVHIDMLVKFVAPRPPNPSDPPGAPVVRPPAGDRNTITRPGVGSGPGGIATTHPPAGFPPVP